MCKACIPDLGKCLEFLLKESLSGSLNSQIEMVCNSEMGYFCENEKLKRPIEKLQVMCLGLRSARVNCPHFGTVSAF